MNQHVQCELEAGGKDDVCEWWLVSTLAENATKQRNGQIRIAKMSIALSPCK